MGLAKALFKSAKKQVWESYNSNMAQEYKETDSEVEEKDLFEEELEQELLNPYIRH